MKRKFIAIVITAVLISGALFTKSYMDLKNSTLYSMLVENLEALTTPDNIYVIHNYVNGTCGYKTITNPGQPNEYWQIECNRSYGDVQGIIKPYQLGYTAWYCCDNCSSSSYCDGRYD